MLYSLLDHIQPEVSDDEQDEAPEAVDFVVDVIEDQGQTPSAQLADVKTLVVCGPGAASVFATATFPALRPAPWRLSPSTKEGRRHFPALPKAPRCFAVEGSGNGGALAAFVLLEGPVAAEFASAWSEAVLAAFPGAAQVLFLDRILSGEWQGFEGQARPAEPHLCGLWTGSTPPRLTHLQQSVDPLPAPNCIQGIGAALLTQCEAGRRSCLAALAVQDGAHLLEGTLRGFERLFPVLEELGLLAPGHRAPDYQPAMRKFMPPSNMSIYA